MQARKTSRSSLSSWWAAVRAVHADSRRGEWSQWVDHQDGRLPTRRSLYVVGGKSAGVSSRRAASARLRKSAVSSSSMSSSQRHGRTVRSDRGFETDHGLPASPHRGTDAGPAADPGDGTRAALPAREARRGHGARLRPAAAARGGVAGTTEAPDHAGVVGGFCGAGGQLPVRFQASVSLSGSATFSAVLPSPTSVKVMITSVKGQSSSLRYLLSCLSVVPLQWGLLQARTDEVECWRGAEERATAAGRALPEDLSALPPLSRWPGCARPGTAPTAVSARGRSTTPRISTSAGPRAGPGSHGWAPPSRPRSRDTGPSAGRSSSGVRPGPPVGGLSPDVIAGQGAHRPGHVRAGQLRVGCAPGGQHGASAGRKPAGARRESHLAAATTRRCSPRRSCMRG